MIRASAHDGAMAIDGDLPADARAYVDGDWIWANGLGPIPALVALEGTMRWGGGPAIAVADAEAAAFCALTAVAREAAGAVKDVPPRAIAVCGSGLVAQEVRRLLGVQIAAERALERPLAFVDTTGDPKVIENATRRLEDMGKLVLAGESLGRQFRINLYTDVHGRGLELIGIGPPTSHSIVGWPLDSHGYEKPTEVAIGAPLPPGRWYRVTAGGE